MHFIVRLLLRRRLLLLASSFLSRESQIAHTSRYGKDASGDDIRYASDENACGGRRHCMKKREKRNLNFSR